MRVIVCVCVHDQTTGWCPLQRRGVFADGSNTAPWPQLQTQPPPQKKKKIIAPTYSHRRMSLNVDHTIHQLWRAQGPSSARTTAPQVVSCLQPPHPPTLHLPCCAQSPSVAGGVVRRPLTPRSCHTNTAPALRLSLLAGIPPHPPVDPAR